MCQWKEHSVPDCNVTVPSLTPGVGGDVVYAVDGGREPARGHFEETANRGIYV